MTRILPVLTCVALAALLSLALVPGGPLPVSSPRAPATRAQAPSPPPGGHETALSRDPFRFGDEEAAGSPTPAPTPRPQPSVAQSAPVPSPLVTLVGFLRGPSGLEAVLSIEGEIVVGRVGQVVEGYSVLAVDEDQGVKLRDPSGQELSIAPQS